MNILVTGGAGFIGSHLTETFLALGHSVFVVDNLSTGAKKNIPEGAEFFENSFDDPAVRSLLKQIKMDAISHHAAQIDVRKSVKDPAVDITLDVLGSVKLFQWAVESSVDYIMLASSGGAIYGEQEQYPADEYHRIRPDSPYGINKWILERYLYYFSRQSSMTYCALRYANVYGPRQNHNSEAGVAAIFTNKMLQNHQAVINGTGEQTRDYVYISDVVAANVQVFEQRYHGELNIGTGTETSVNELYEHLKILTKGDKDKQYGPAKAGEQFRSVLSCDKARQKIQWSPTVSLREGLKKTVDYFSECYDSIGTGGNNE